MDLVYLTPELNEEVGREAAAYIAFFSLDHLSSAELANLCQDSPPPPLLSLAQRGVRVGFSRVDEGSYVCKPDLPAAAAATLQPRLPRLSHSGRLVRSLFARLLLLRAGSSFMDAHDSGGGRH